MQRPPLTPDTFRSYSPAARSFHWWTVAFIAAQLPLGVYMVYRGDATSFDALTGKLYDAHKLIGFVLLWLVVVRLIYRLTHGAPPDEPTLRWYEKAAANATHWTLYLLLLAVPLLGWLGVSLYGARSIFGIMSLPALATENQDAATRVFTFHKFAAFAIMALAAMHIGAALFHFVIRKDGVLQRMLPGLRR